jgi:hypothetical protein
MLGTLGFLMKGIESGPISWLPRSEILKPVDFLMSG